MKPHALARVQQGRFKLRVDTEFIFASTCLVVYARDTSLDRPNAPAISKDDVLNLLGGRRLPSFRQQSKQLFNLSQRSFHLFAFSFTCSHFRHLDFKYCRNIETCKKYDINTIDYD